MKTTALKLGIVCAVVLAGIATPMVIKHNAAVSLRENNAALRQQADRLAQLAGENQRLSNLVAQAKPPLSDEQFRELLRLRGEMGMLRRQTNAIQKLRAENRRLAARLATAQNREGFQRLVAEVSLRHAGIVLGLILAAGIREPERQKWTGKGGESGSIVPLPRFLSKSNCVGQRRSSASTIPGGNRAFPRKSQPLPGLRDDGRIWPVTCLESSGCA